MQEAVHDSVLLCGEGIHSLQDAFREPESADLYHVVIILGLWLT